MDGPFIRAGSRSAANERAAVYFRDEWHNDDQLGLLIYLLLSGKGHGICSFGQCRCREIGVCAAEKHMTEESHSEWHDEWWMNEDAHDEFSPLLCEHSVPVIWCFYIFPPNFYFSHRRLSKLQSTDKSAELTGLHREVRENSKLKWGMLKTTYGPDVMYIYG